MRDVYTKLLEVREVLEDLLGEYPDDGDHIIYSRIEKLSELADSVSNAVAQNLEG